MMVQAQARSEAIGPMSFEAFLDWHPEDGRQFELIEGEVVEMLPTGPHEDVGGLISGELSFEIRQRALPFSIPRSCVIKLWRMGSIGCGGLWQDSSWRRWCFLSCG